MAVIPGTSAAVLFVSYVLTSSLTQCAEATPDSHYGNCDFNGRNLCNWTNTNEDQFDWSVRKGPTTSSSTGPNQDHSGKGSYIYIETSRPRIYGEKARLISPSISGPVTMTFKYHMYGVAIETLSIYTKNELGNQTLLWSRYGNHGNKWIHGCVHIIENGTFKVLLVAVAGGSYTADIAIDDIAFTSSLIQCSNTGNNTHAPSAFNCTFDENFCGWRNFSDLAPLAAAYRLSWNMRKGPTPQSTGPRRDHTGNGSYLYAPTRSASTTAMLISPQTTGQHCVRFYYHFHGSVVGFLKVAIFRKVRPSINKVLFSAAWSPRGAWGEAVVNMSLGREYQVLISGSTETALDDVTVTDGLCDVSLGIASSFDLSKKRDCNFEVSTDSNGWCGWTNDKDDRFDWTRRFGTTPSSATGPSGDYPTGRRIYIYIETSNPRRLGDNARISSPWMVGVQCMSFYYHMYGSSMGCVLIYVRDEEGEELRPLWVRSGNQGNKWHNDKVTVNSNKRFQVVIEGVRGTNYEGDAAVDKITFNNGQCSSSGLITYYVSSDGSRYNVNRKPSSSDQHWQDEFRFQVPKMTTNTSSNVLYFFFPKFATTWRRIKKTRLIDKSKFFPIGRIVSNTGSGMKVYIYDLWSAQVQEISLTNTSFTQCCQDINTSFIEVSNITKAGISVTFQCLPGWYRAGSACYRIEGQTRVNWYAARIYCHKLNSELAVINNTQDLNAISKLLSALGHVTLSVFVGLRGNSQWTWENNQQVVSNLWEFRSQGECGVIAKFFSWKWFSVNCAIGYGYICEDVMAFPNPIALYPLDGRRKTNEISPNPISKGRSYSTLLAPGPYGHPNGSYYFKGLANSFIEFRHEGGLDAEYSITILTWIFPEGKPGPIFNYRINGFGVHLWVVSPGRMFARFVFRNNMWPSGITANGLLKQRAWNYVGASYAYNTGLARLWMGNRTVALRNIGAKKKLYTQAHVRMGARRGDNRYFKGRISCLQIYDQALTDEQINHARNICTRNVPIRCREGYVPIRGLCLHVEGRNKLPFSGASVKCQNQKARLAIIDRTYHRKALSDYLLRTRHDRTPLYIGLVVRSNWKWLDGRSLDTRLWAGHYPLHVGSSYTCGTVSGQTARLKNQYCSNKMGFICQKRELNVAHGRVAMSSSTTPGSLAAYATDGFFLTCFASQKERNPRWIIEFDESVYLYKTEIKKQHDCCKTHLSFLTVSVTDDTGNTTHRCGRSQPYGVQQAYVFNCELPLRAKYLTVSSKGGNGSLVLCEVVTSSLRTPDGAQGLVREVWYSTTYNGKLSRNMKENQLFKTKPSGMHVIPGFEAPRDVSNYYVQRLTTYLKVPYSGNFTFYIVCDDKCELWHFDVYEKGIGHVTKQDGLVNIVPLAKSDRPTGPNNWNKYPSQASSPVFLHHCYLYKLEVYMVELGGRDYLSVGIKFPDNETYERPIHENRLFRMLTGKRKLTVSFGYDNWISAYVGPEIAVKGYYQYCCNGIYCPGCPLVVSLLINGEKFLLSDMAQMDCNKTEFTVTFNGVVQPGNYSIEAIYSFVNDTVGEKKDKTGTLELKPEVLDECRFVQGICSWSRNKASTDLIWKVNNRATPLADRDNYAFIDGKYQASLASSPLPFKPFYNQSCVCLRFLYRMSGTSTSYLEVSKHFSDVKKLIWRISGYHGDEWQEGRISWVGAPNIKIVFNGTGSINGSASIAITNVQITTETCAVQPTFSLPGFICGGGHFKCDNGQCIKKNLHCDGDKNCVDGSDENNCRCPTNKFLCPSRECISSAKLCNGEKNCKDRSDEKNCDLHCANEFQCVAGSCTSWSSTCKKIKNCPEFTNNPQICGMAKNCPLNNLGCTAARNTTSRSRPNQESLCKSFWAHCYFENGLCGLQHDKDATFQWTSGYGSTPTENTGPRFDHTTLTQHGSYIYIEASLHKHGDNARLMSDWLDANETMCLQFWYHMYGKNIGQLNVLVKTNKSEKIVWQQTGNHRNQWTFAQTPLSSYERYKFVLEGVTADGWEGDIAVDDLSMISTSCDKVLHQNSTDCYFEGNQCAWKSHQDWILKKSSWRNEDCIYLPAGHAWDAPKNISTPKINNDFYELKCLRFWYYIETPPHRHEKPRIQVLLRSSKANYTHMFTSADIINTWLFVQLPVPKQYRAAEVIFIGRHHKLHGGIFLDNISFLRGKCGQIPWNQQALQQTQASTSSITYWLEGEKHFTAPPGGTITVRGCLKYCRANIYCPSCIRQVYLNAGSASVCIMKSTVLDCKTKCFTTGLAVPTIAGNHYIRMFELLNYVCKNNSFNNKGLVIGRVTVLGDCQNKNFEEGTLIGWQPIGGTAFNNQPTYGDNPGFRSQQQSNLQGKWWIATYENRPSPSARPGNYQGNGPVGILKSQEFQITGASMNFSLGGGCDVNTVRVELFVREKSVMNATGQCSSSMYRVYWDVGKYKGLYAHLKIVDLSSSRNGYISFDDLNGDFKCSGATKCPLSLEWCGWKNGDNSSDEPRWIMVQYDVISAYNKYIDSYYMKNNITYPLAPNDFEMSFMGNTSSTGFELRGIPALDGFTFCLWLKTSFSGFYIKYKIDADAGSAVGIGIDIADCINMTIIGRGEENQARKIKRNLIDNEWHFLCVKSSMTTNTVYLYIDGEIATELETYSYLMTDRGVMKIGHRERVNRTGVIGTISSLNVWKWMLSSGQIRRMSLGCGMEQGNVKSWVNTEKVLNGILKKNTPSTCKDRKAGRLVLLTKFKTTGNKTITINPIASPRYPRSQRLPYQCLRFLYMLHGSGARSLKVYQHTDTGINKPIWVAKELGNIGWRYGQVPVSGVERFQVVFSGEIDDRPGYIALASVSLKEKLCKHMPKSAIKACNEHLSDAPGYVTSPYYPGYYINSISCIWRITAPTNHVIRVKFLDFVLEEHVTCSKDFVEMHDGNEVTSPLLGRFCGYTYPQLVESSSNHITIIFNSDFQFVRRGFKAYYYFERAVTNTEFRCFRHQGCPSDCECTDISGKRTWSEDSRILVEGERLLVIPNNLPVQTTALLFQQNRISQLIEDEIKDLPYLTHIDLSNNILLHVDDNSFRNLTSLDTLRMNSNFIRKLPSFVFKELYNLNVMDLGRNLMYELSQDTFDGLANLTVLSLRSNRLNTLPTHIFNDTRNLTHLYLQNNIISVLADGIFRHLSNLQLLDLSNNKLMKLTKETFQGLESLKYLYLGKNKLSDVSPDAFSGLQKLEYLKVDRFILCCYAEKAVDGLDCRSPRDGFSSCDDLMKNKGLQICVWLLGLMALVGNVFVVGWRISDKQCNQTHSFLLTNLAISDLLMGVYLMIIAIMDMKWQGEYFKHDVAWRSGLGCQFAGIISMLSSEVSVLVLTVITADRLVCIVFPFKFKRITKKRAAIMCGIVWLFGIVISVLPVTGIEYFYDDQGDFGFFGRSGVCLALQLSQDRPAGWEYSVAFFIVINSTAFLFILIAYVAMFWTVKRVSGAVRSTSMNKESAMAKKLIFIIMTDFCCWMPVIVIGILSLTGVFYDPTKQVYAWIAVFVLPVNSSINPILYTFSTTHVRKRMQTRRKGLNQFLARTISLNGLKGRKRDTPFASPQSMADDATQLSTCGSIPLTEIRSGHRMTYMESPKPARKMRLIEIPNILQDDTTTGVGYVIAMIESRDMLGMHLVKYFSKGEEAAWKDEVDLALELFRDKGLPNIMNYRWHSVARALTIDYGKLKIPHLKGSSFLICYDFVSSTTLEDFLVESATTMNFDTLCVLAIDVITAIEHLEAHGISHNNINTRTILVSHSSRIPPVQAVLGAFSKATTNKYQNEAYTNEACENTGYHGNDIGQFGQLLAVLLGHCHGSSEYSEIHEIMKTCFDENVEEAERATIIRTQLENAYCSDGVWDTFL